MIFVCIIISLVNSFIILIDLCVGCNENIFAISFYRISIWLSAVSQMGVLVMTCIVWVPSCNQRKVFPVQEVDKSKDIEKVGESNQISIVKTEQDYSKYSRGSMELANKINMCLNSLPENINFIHLPTSTGGFKTIQRDLNEEEVMEYYGDYLQHKNYIFREKAIQRIKYKNLIRTIKQHKWQK